MRKKRDRKSLGGEKERMAYERKERDSIDEVEEVMENEERMEAEIEEIKAELEKDKVIETEQQVSREDREEIKVLWKIPYSKDAIIEAGKKASELNAYARYNLKKGCYEVVDKNTPDLLWKED